MAKFDESEMINSLEFQGDSDKATLKFLSGGYSRLGDTTADLSEKVDSMETKMDAMQRTLQQISNQLGQRPIAAETSRQSPPVPYFSDSYIRDDPTRLPLDNRKRLLRKIDMPKFDGKNAYDWLSKVERFFRVGRYSDFDKLDLVALSLEGDVLKWFNWKLICGKFHSWDDFRRRLLLKYGAASKESPRNRLLAIKQTGPISAYVTQFEELSAQVTGLDELHLEEIFYKGLKPAMREVLKLKEPVGLENQKKAVLRMGTSSFCHLSSAKSTTAWGSQKPITPKPVTTSIQPRPLLLPNGEGQDTGQFMAAPEEAPGNRRFAIKQNETVSTYVTEFEELSAPVIVQQTVHKEASITHLQVPVSNLEHSLQLHTESPNVCGNYQAVIGCDALGKEENLFSVLSLASQVWEPGGVLTLKEPVGLVNQKKSRCLQASMFNFKRKKKRIKRWFNTLSCRESWRQHKHENLQIVSGLLGFNVVYFRCHKEYGLTKQIEENLVFQQLVIAQKIECGWICGDVKFHLKHKWRFRLLQSFSRLILWAWVSLCFSKAYALSELLKDSNNGKAESFTAAEEFYRKVQPLLWLQISSENYLMVMEFEKKKQLLCYKTRMFKYKAPLRRGQFLQYFAQEVPMQMVVDWLRKAAHILGLTHPFRPGLAIGVPPALIAGTLLVPENFWMFSKVFVQLYPSSKLEDKLVFEGGSIDTIKQSYYRKKKPWVETEGFSCKEALEGNGGFAVSLEV